MAMLWLNGGVKAVKVLLQRGFPYMLSATCLFIFCVVYFILAAITAGKYLSEESVHRVMESTVVIVKVIFMT